jgi:hypothetical protein
MITKKIHVENHIPYSNHGVYHDGCSNFMTHLIGVATTRRYPSCFELCFDTACTKTAMFGTHYGPECCENHVSSDDRSIDYSICGRCNLWYRYSGYQYCTVCGTGQIEEDENVIVAFLRKCEIDIANFVLKPQLSPVFRPLIMWKAAVHDIVLDVRLANDTGAPPESINARMLSMVHNRGRSVVWIYYNPGECTIDNKNLSFEYRMLTLQTVIREYLVCNPPHLQYTLVYLFYDNDL